MVMIAGAGGAGAGISDGSIRGVRSSCSNTREKKWVINYNIVSHTKVSRTGHGRVSLVRYGPGSGSGSAQAVCFYGIGFYT